MTTRNYALKYDLQMQLDRLADTIEALGWTDAEAAVSEWQNDRESDGAQAWHNPMASAIRHGIDLACDTDARVDTCHIRIDWPFKGQAITYSFPATGDDSEDALNMEHAVANALIGRIAQRRVRATEPAHGDAAHD